MQKVPKNRLCVIGFILSIISFVVDVYGLLAMTSLFLSVIGVIQCTKRGESGKYLGISGMIIGSVCTSLSFVLF